MIPGMRRKTQIAVAVMLLLFALGSANSEEGVFDLEGDLIVFHAGSLSVPFREISQEFEKIHPGVDVLCEAAGSRSCARKVTDLGRPCDVLASADYTVIDTLLIPQHADWNLKFASNEMVIAFRNESRFSKLARHDKWPELLLDDSISFGRSDPNCDPCGYRTVMAIKLAEKQYGLPGFSDRLLAKDKRYIRPKETDLLALLEVGELDCFFIYRSVAQQHGLGFLKLPDEINLKSEKLAGLYRGVSVSISGRSPGEYITKVGEPMVYGVTVPKNSPNPKAAIAFVSFLLDSERGMAIMKKNGQPSLVPAPTDSYGRLPVELRSFGSKDD